MGGSRWIIEPVRSIPGRQINVADQRWRNRVDSELITSLQDVVFKKYLEGHVGLWRSWIDLFVGILHDAVQVPAFRVPGPEAITQFDVGPQRGQGGVLEREQAPNLAIDQVG